MRNYIVLAFIAAASTSVRALPVVLLNCAGGEYQTHLETIRPGGDAAGVLMGDAIEAKARAGLVVQNSTVSLVGANSATAVVRVVKILDTITDHGVTCLVFTGVNLNEPIMPTGTWSSAQGAPQPPRRPSEYSAKGK